MDIYSYLEDNNIVIGDEDFQKVIINKSNWAISQQIDLIVNVQNILMGQKNTIIPRVNSSIGKEYESLKVQIKKTTKNLAMLNDKKNKEKIDYYILEEGERVLNRAKQSIISINQEEYIQLIRRSMNNYEMCLGRVDESNLKLTSDGLLKIRTLKYLSYNLIEHDILNYIKKLRKRGYCGEVGAIIEEFVNKSNLSKKSVDYLKALSSYPIESMKILNRYKLDEVSIISNEFIKEINLAIKNDGKELI